MTGETIAEDKAMTARSNMSPEDLQAAAHQAKTVQTIPTTPQHPLPSPLRQATTPGSSSASVAGSSSARKASLTAQVETLL